MRKNNPPYITLLTKVAAKSNHRQHRMAALLMKGGKVIDVHENNDHIHAEHAVLNRAWRSGANGTTLVVIRIKASGKLGMAKPCQICQARMASAGVKKVIYTNDAGSVEVLRIEKKEAVNKPIEYKFVKSARMNKK